MDLNHSLIHLASICLVATSQVQFRQADVQSGNPSIFILFTPFFKERGVFNIVSRKQLLLLLYIPICGYSLFIMWKEYGSWDFDIGSPFLRPLLSHQTMLFSGSSLYVFPPVKLLQLLLWVSGWWQNTRGNLHKISCNTFLLLTQWWRQPNPFHDWENSKF